MFLHVFKHFEDFQEDQFDFHTYCLRKMTLRTYVEMLRMEDELYHHIYYSKAAWGAIQTYLLLLDQPDKNAKVSKHHALTVQQEGAIAKAMQIIPVCKTVDGNWLKLKTGRGSWRSRNGGVDAEQSLLPPQLQA